MKRALLALSILATADSALAAFGDSARGTSSAQFLLLGAGARETAMGDAVVAGAEGAPSLYWNPARMTSVERRSASFMHSARVGGSSLEYLGYVQALGSRWSLGASLQYFSFGSVDETDTTGASVGSLNPNDAAVAFGAAHRLPGENPWSVGASIKAVRTEVRRSAMAFAVDLGATTPSFGAFSGALVVQNAGTKLKLDADATPLPLVVRAGVRWARPTRSVELDLISPRDNSPHFAIGGEQILRATQSIGVAARAGFNSRAARDGAGFSGMTFGFGILLPRASVDYALATVGALGMDHRLSATIRF